MFTSRVHAVAISAVLLCSALPGDAWAGEALGPSFDYSMPARFAIPPLATGFPDEAGEIYSDPLPAVGQENLFVQPAVWPVVFDACASTGPIVEYRFSVGGVPAATSAVCNDISLDFPSEGSFSVSLTVADGIGNEATVDSNVLVNDWLIVALGDSYASGEGAPDVAIGSFEIDAANQAESDVELAQTATDEADALSQQAQADLLEIEAAVADALALQTAFFQALSDEENCDPFDPLGPLSCPAAALEVATTSFDFAAALFELSVNLDIDEFALVTAALDGLIGAATTARDDAIAAASSAAATLETTLADLDAALLALEARWRNQRCHRSALSGQVLAAQQLEASDPRSSVTFIHLPCSGASIEQGIIGPYEGIDPVVLNEVTGTLEPAATPLPAQLDRAREIVCGASCGPEDREVDLFLLSIGGNDVNFGEIIETCIAGEPCFDAPVPDNKTATATGLLCLALGPFREDCDDYFGGLTSFDAEDAFLFAVDELLPGHYQSLQNALASAFDADAGSRLFLTEYPDVTKDETGSHCGWEITQSPGDQAKNLPGLSPIEIMWADTVVQTQLADAMQTAAATHGWSLVDGIASSFTTHGYCSTDNWITRAQESLLSQGDVEGTFHPTATGQLAYRDAILVAVPTPPADLLAASALATLPLLLAVKRLRPRNRGRDVPPSRP